MIVIVANNNKPGTATYRKALELVSRLDVDVNDVALVDSTVSNFDEFIRCAQMGKGYRLISLNHSVAKKFEQKNIPIFTLRQFEKVEVQKCKKWLRQTSST